jgi:hypothetical protein
MRKTYFLAVLLVLVAMFLLSGCGGGSDAVAEGEITGPSKAVNLAWDASSTPGVEGYRIYVGRTSGNYDTSVDVGNVLESTLEVSGLGTHYIAAVSYLNDPVYGYLESVYSNEVHITIQSVDQTTPEPPGTLRIVE